MRGAEVRVVRDFLLDARVAVQTSLMIELNPHWGGNGMPERVSVRRGQGDRRVGPYERREPNRRSAERRQVGGTADEERRMAPRRTRMIRSGLARRGPFRILHQ